MTKESIELLTHMCRDRIWETPFDMSDELKEIWAGWTQTDNPYFDGNKHVCVIGKKFETEEAATQYRESVNELHEVFVGWSIIAGTAIVYKQDSPLFSSWLQFGKNLFIEVWKKEAQILFDQNYIWNGGGWRTGDFIDFMSRANGKHWDEIKGMPNLEAES